ncbi:DNA recombination protein RmuC [Chryseobacterium sp. POL2]|uniref:DNA recombination protein RmuC n=1 Tax=Chryseobacterium sp. POL2 TaxID=2713414 RepID=UPI0013E171E9|nr:DNA recombination protein RmuC [Chryseobacterium sp. POL2]QIG89443.1 DNA recombination protein RmuC [Chryseobacterium sp. POL2]
MDWLSLLVGLVAGIIIGILVLYFYYQTKISTKTLSFEKEISSLHSEVSFSKSNLENSEKQKENLQLKNEDLESKVFEYHQKLAEQNADNLNLVQQLDDIKFDLKQLQDKQEVLLNDKQTLIAQNAELNAQNKNFEILLKNQKEEIEKLQKQSQLHFEKMANQILEEKTEKFTNLNQQHLKSILEPFGKNLDDLKKTVHETYDKESKERFSLGEKVNELKLLNQQISQEANKLIKALKGESKTQGNWGEMILESILEKSGLTKNREYFLEHELRDDHKNPIYSEFSGKKMRPDAIIKYPDQRNVIIDSKVSLTAFIEMANEEDVDIFKIKQNQHLASIKNHINELSNKAYDDFDKSLDFVMLFVPSEAAYNAALQADTQLWNYAYDKRILLLSPTNLITSLKLIADLWKREYQNKNAMEIAERGAKLYDKFVSFVDKLEKIGKSIDQAQSSYDEAYKQLSTGNDNLVLQTEKLRKLGLKNKKQLSNGMTETSKEV